MDPSHPSYPSTTLALSLCVTSGVFVCVNVCDDPSIHPSIHPSHPSIASIHPSYPSIHRIHPPIASIHPSYLCIAFIHPSHPSTHPIHPPIPSIHPPYLSIASINQSVCVCLTCARVCVTSGVFICVTIHPSIHPYIASILPSYPWHSSITSIRSSYPSHSSHPSIASIHSHILSIHHILCVCTHTNTPLYTSPSPKHTESRWWVGD